MFLSTIPNLSYVKKRRYRISLTFKNDNTESLLRLKTTIPNLSYVKKRQYRTFLILNTEQKRQYRRKNRKGFRRFWLEKPDNTDNFLRLKTENFSTGVAFCSLQSFNYNNCCIHAKLYVITVYSNFDANIVTRKIEWKDGSTQNSSWGKSRFMISSV